MSTKQIFLYSNEKSDVAQLFFSRNVQVQFIIPQSITYLSPEDDLCLLEAVPSDLGNLNFIIDYLKTKDANIVVYGDESVELNQFLFKKNIIRFISKENLINFPFSIFVRKPEKREENFALLDKGTHCFDKLKGVMEFFNASCEVFSNQKEFFASLDENNYSAVYVDINSSDFDMSDFVKSAIARQLNLTTPVIPYISSDQGIDSSAVRCGLNRIAKVILNYEETLSFTVHYFMKKEISRVNKSISSGKIFNGISDYYDSFPNLYFNKKDSFFNTEHPFPQTDYRQIFDVTSNMRNIIYRQMQIEWLTDGSLGK